MSHRASFVDDDELSGLWSKVSSSLSRVWGLSLPTPRPIVLTNYYKRTPAYPSIKYLLKYSFFVMNPYADLLESKDASPVAKKRKLDSAPGTATLPIIEEPSPTTTKAPECPVVPAEGIRKDPAAKRPVDVSEALSKLKSFLSNAKYV